MPIHNMSRVAMVETLEEIDAGIDILRAYTVRMAIVDRVDNQGEPCSFCDNCGWVAVTIYATSIQDGAQWADCCLSCIVYVLDNQLDADPAEPVVIEIARGVR